MRNKTHFQPNLKPCNESNDMTWQPKIYHTTSQTSPSSSFCTWKAKNLKLHSRGQYYYFTLAPSHAHSVPPSRHDTLHLRVQRFMAEEPRQGSLRQAPKPPEKKSAQGRPCSLRRCGGGSWRWGSGGRRPPRRPAPACRRSCARRCGCCTRAHGLLSSSPWPARRRLLLLLHTSELTTEFQAFSSRIMKLDSFL